MLSALAGGRHQQYLDDPDLLGAPETIQDGNGILGHILGSKDVSRAVAARAAENTGIGADILKRMLPVVATMAMGALSKQASAPGFQSALSGGQPSGILGMLTPFLDANQDGSIADDVIGMLGKFLRR